jgi:hypothetical protein
MSWPRAPEVDECHMNALLFPTEKAPSRFVEPDYFNFHQTYTQIPQGSPRMPTGVIHKVGRRDRSQHQVVGLKQPYGRALPEQGFRAWGDNISTSARDMSVNAL